MPDDSAGIFTNATSASNRAHAGRADIRLASVDALPFVNAGFDRAVSVNTLYFWPDPVHGLTELRRVLKPDGLLLLACVSPETAATSPTMKREFGFAMYSETQIIEMHRAADFSMVTIEPFAETGHRMDGTPYPRHCLLSIAIR